MGPVGLAGPAAKPRPVKRLPLARRASGVQPLPKLPMKSARPYRCDTRQSCAGFLDRVTHRCRFCGQASSAQLKLEMQTMGVIYTDFQSCVNFLKVRVPARAVPADPESHPLTSQSELNPDDIKATSAMMQGFDFHIYLFRPNIFRLHLGQK